MRDPFFAIQWVLAGITAAVLVAYDLPVSATVAIVMGGFFLAFLCGVLGQGLDER